jgi:uncharacterized repeat protein (TIGR03803 family)
LASTTHSSRIWREAPALVFLLASIILPAQAQAQKFKVLHTFKGTDGALPYAKLTRDAAGNLYGTTSEGGKGICSSFGCGTAFKMNDTGKEVWLHSFKGGNGRQPMAGLLRSSSGNLFGTTVAGGSGTKVCPEIGCGIVFKLDGAGTETVLHRFKGTPDGFEPEALLVEDASGNFYDTTTVGGNSGGLGTIFKLDSAGKETVLHSFTGGGDGCYPFDGLIFDAAGNLYGTAVEGGAAFCNSGYGVVFELDATGKFTVLYTFAGNDGAYPSALLLDSAGNLYGTAGGGNSTACVMTDCGVVFELSPRGSGTWTETVLYDFCSLDDCADGEEPNGPLVRDSAGNLYGTTYRGGNHQDCNGEGCGVVFKLDSTGNETVLHSFTDGADGAGPSAGLIMDHGGNLYGTAFFGGSKEGACAPYGCGTLFKITP